jgi:hypothetical protein
MYYSLANKNTCNHYKPFRVRQTQVSGKVLFILRIGHLLYTDKTKAKQQNWDGKVMQEERTKIIVNVHSED